MNHRRGFTLIEIMIALIILSGLSVLIGQSVRSGLDSKKRIQRQIDDESAVRDTVRLMASDIAAAYHHRDLAIKLYNQVIEARKRKASGQADPNSTPPPGGVAPVPTPLPTANPNLPPDPLANATPFPSPKPRSQFIGETDRVAFTVSNHVRRFVDAKESDLAEIGYSIRSCGAEEGVEGRRKSQGSYRTTCLVRRESSLVDEDPTTGGTETILLLYVSEFKLRYIARDRTEPLETWNSRQGDETSGRFPDAVEIQLTVHDKEDPNSRQIKMNYVAPIRFPNNPDKKTAENANGGQGAATGSNPNASPTPARQF
jgi:prepilin-type N-terminal cleavage/methylation domain-containing protein